MDMNEIFNNGGFSPDWTERYEEVGEETAALPQRKDLDTLIRELDDIKSTISDLELKSWHLGKRIKYHEKGFSTT